MQVVNNVNIELRQCKVIGKVNILETGILEDCVIIPMCNIKQLDHKLQGVKLIETLPDYEV